MSSETEREQAIRERPSIVAKAWKLIEALSENCEQPAGDDHAWRRCRRCLATEEIDTEDARRLLRILLGERVRLAAKESELEKALSALSSARAPEQPRLLALERLLDLEYRIRAVAGESFVLLGWADEIKLAAAALRGEGEQMASKTFYECGCMEHGDETFSCATHRKVEPMIPPSDPPAPSFDAWFKRLCEEDDNPAGLWKVESLCRLAFEAGKRAALSPPTPAAPQEEKGMNLPHELRQHLDTMTITGENIGDIRRSLFVPWDSAWNGIVRDETAQRERPASREEELFRAGTIDREASDGIRCHEIEAAGGGAEARDDDQDVQVRQADQGQCLPPTQARVSGLAGVGGAQQRDVATTGAVAEGDAAGPAEPIVEGNNIHDGGNRLSWSGQAGFSILPVLWLCLGLAVCALAIAIIGVYRLPARSAKLNVIQSRSVGVIDAGFDPVPAIKHVAVVDAIPQVEMNLFRRLRIESIPVVVKLERLRCEISRCLIWRNQGAAFGWDAIPVRRLWWRGLHGWQGFGGDREGRRVTRNDRVDAELKQILGRGWFFRHAEVDGHPGPLAVLKHESILDNSQTREFVRLSGGVGCIVRDLRDEQRRHDTGGSQPHIRPVRRMFQSIDELSPHDAGTRLGLTFWTFWLRILCGYGLIVIALGLLGMGRWWAIGGLFVLLFACWWIVHGLHAKATRQVGGLFNVVVAIAPAHPDAKRLLYGRGHVVIKREAVSQYMPATKNIYVFKAAPDEVACLVLSEALAVSCRNRVLSRSRSVVMRQDALGGERDVIRRQRAVFMLSLARLREAGADFNLADTDSRRGAGISEINRDARGAVDWEGLDVSVGGNNPRPSVEHHRLPGQLKLTSGEHRAANSSRSGQEREQVEAPRQVYRSGFVRTPWSVTFGIVCWLVALGIGAHGVRYLRFGCYRRGSLFVGFGLTLTVIGMHLIFDLTSPVRLTWRPDAEAAPVERIPRVYEADRPIVSGAARRDPASDGRLQRAGGQESATTGAEAEVAFTASGPASSAA